MREIRPLGLMYEVVPTRPAESAQPCSQGRFLLTGVGASSRRLFTLSFGHFETFCTQISPAFDDPTQ